MRLVLVEWVDSFGCAPDWRPLDSCAPDLLVCRSVGWLLHEDERCLVVVPHRTDGGAVEPQGCGDMTIPRVAVLRVLPLEEP